MCVPVLRALQNRYAHLYLTVLTPRFLQPFFRGIPRIEFFAPDLKGRHKGLRGLVRLWRDLGRFDGVADLHDVLRSKVLRGLFRSQGTPVRHIDKGRAAKRALTSSRHKHLEPLRPTVVRYAEVFRRMGFALPEIPLPVRMRYPLSETTAQIVGEKRERWIGIAPFAQHQGKIYPLEQMEKVIAGLARCEGVRLFLFGGGAREKAYAEAVASGVERVTPMIGRVSLQEELELISQLDLMVSMDSSALHMASLVGVPVISIWGATHPYAGFYGFGQDPADAIQRDLACRPCAIYGNKPCRWGDFRCMGQIPPSEIIEKVKQKIGALDDGA